MIDPIAEPQGLITHDNVWQFGVLGVVCLGLVAALVVMWRHNVRRDDQRSLERESMEKERNEWAKERELRRVDSDRSQANLRAEYESKHRDLSDRYGRELGEQVKSFRENDSAVRREFAGTLESMSESQSEQLERMAEAQSKQADRQVVMIEKLTDRIVIATKPRGGY